MSELLAAADLAPTALPTTVGSLHHHHRKPSLASVGMAAFATAGSTRNLAALAASSPHGAARVPSSPSSFSSSPSPAAAAVTLRRQQLLAMKTAHRSLSSAQTLDQQRIDVFFHVPTLRELQRLRVPRALTLVGLQALVQREFRVPFEDQRLYCHGDLLEGDEDLAFYDVHDQSVLNVRVRKRYRALGDVFTTVQTVRFLSPKLPDDYEIVEVVVPLPPTHILFKRLVLAIAYLHRLDVLQARRTQRRVWKLQVSFWDDAPPSTAAAATVSVRRRSSLLPSAITGAATAARGRSDDTAAGPCAPPPPPSYVMLHAGPERVASVVSLAQTHAIAARLQLPLESRSPSDLRHLKKWLASIKFLASAALPDAALLEIARACVYVRFAAGDFLFRQGDVGDHFYILVTGCVSLAAYGNGFFATMTPGRCFGEISLVGGAGGRRTASANVAFAAPCAELALLSGDIYRRVISPYKKAVLHLTERAIDSVPQLRALPDHIVTHIAYAAKTLEAKPGRRLVHHGEELNVLVLLVAGEVKVSLTARAAPHAVAYPVVSVVRAPAVFGQEAVLTNTPSPAPWDIESLDTCKLLCLRTDTLSIFLATRQEIVHALNREHALRLEDLAKRFGQHAAPPAATTRNAAVPAAAVAKAKMSKASYMRMLHSRLFESSRSLLMDAAGHHHHDRDRGRRGAASHVQFPNILLRRPEPSDDDDVDNDDARPTTETRAAVAATAAQREPSRTATPTRSSWPNGVSCADVQDAFLHRTLPFGNILALREQIQFCSFAAHELERPDRRGRTRALLRGLRHLPVEEVELADGDGDGDPSHFRFVPRPPTSPASSAWSGPPRNLHPHALQRRNLQTR